VKQDEKNDQWAFWTLVDPCIINLRLSRVPLGGYRDPKGSHPVTAKAVRPARRKNDLSRRTHAIDG